MRYTVTVFFDGPRSSFSQKLHPSEAVYTASVPWLWLARAIARGQLGNTGRLGYVIKDGEKTIDEVRAPIEFAPAS